jgi:hypothetical protein
LDVDVLQMPLLTVLRVAEGESHDGHDHEPPPHYEDSQLEFMIDPLLKSDDINNDGMIDYAEFIAAQLKNKAGFRDGIQMSV